MHCKRMQKWKTRSPVSLVPFSNISCLQRDSSSMSMQICNTLYFCYNICNFCLRLLFLLLLVAVVVVVCSLLCVRLSWIEFCLFVLYSIFRIYQLHRVWRELQWENKNKTMQKKRELHWKGQIIWFLLWLFVLLAQIIVFVLFGVKAICEHRLIGH